MAIGSVAAIAVVVIAIAVTGHGRHVHAPAARQSVTPACTRRLLAQLGVLRRPQTQADRTFNPQAIPIARKFSPSSAMSPFVVVAGLTRLARTLPNGRRVFFVVYSPVPGSLAASGGDVAQVFVAGDGARSTAFGDAVYPALLSSSYQLPPSEVANDYLSVVPDGVTRVEWTSARVTVPRFTAPGGRVFPGHVIPMGELTASVQGNVAAAAETPEHPLIGPPSTTWLAADGHVIKSFRVKAPDLAQGIPKSGTTETLTSVGAMTASSC